MTQSTVDLSATNRLEHHRLLINALDDVPRGGQIHLVTDYDPHELMLLVDAHYCSAVGWETLHRGPEKWRLILRKVATTAIPRVLCSTTHGTSCASPEEPGALWSLTQTDSQVAARVLWVPPQHVVPPHHGPVVDVIVHVLAGGGTLLTERQSVPMSVGDVLYLPRKSERSFVAGDHGLRYLAVHAAIHCVQSAKSSATTD